MLINVGNGLAMKAIINDKFCFKIRSFNYEF